MQRVLVVDDERIIADTLQLIFRKHGFDARAAYSAEEALQTARAFHPTLLLCDINMPGRSGLSLAADVTREQPTCRILVLTALSTSVNRRPPEFPDTWGLLAKPIHPEALLRAADAVLAS